MGWNRRAGDGSTRRADGSTQRSAGRTAPLRLWAPGCSAGRSERTTGGRCGGASHALRHVSQSLASIHSFDDIPSQRSESLARSISDALTFRPGVQGKPSVCSSGTHARIRAILIGRGTRRPARGNPQPAVHHEVLVGGLSTKHRLPVSKILADKREYQTAAGCRTAQIMHRSPHGRLGQVRGRVVNCFSIVAISARRAGDHRVLSRRRFDRSTAADVAPRDCGPVAMGQVFLARKRRNSGQATATL